jgi:hypothetical protein
MENQRFGYRHLNSVLRVSATAVTRHGFMMLGVLIAIVALSSVAVAAPEAHILRIDPRASLVEGEPLLTSVIELVQNKRMSEITSRCAFKTGNANLDCQADALEKPEALYDVFPFPQANAIFTVTVDGTDRPAKFISKTRWGASYDQDGVGTAWLILVDAAHSMGRRFKAAQGVARTFVESMGPQDIVNIMFFGDRAILRDSKWLSKKSAALSFVNSVGRTFPPQGRTRQLFQIIKQAATDGFRELGNAGSGIKVPMHQSMVILSNGVSGSDTGSPAQSALLLKQFMTKGRFPEDNKTLPKSPVPIVSVWFPTRQMEEFFQNARQFMENLANHEIGGFYSIMRAGQGYRAKRIVSSVRRRFDQMHIIKWRVACIAPTVGQTFKLVFKSTNPPIAGDNFIDVPVGIDPSSWPLDIDVEATMRAAKKSPLYPGGKVKVFGDFCWGSDHKRAQLYMIPKKQPAPASLKGQSVENARKAQKKLIEAGMVGKSITSGDTFVEFEVPEKTK